MDRKVQPTEAALEQGSSRVSTLPSTSESQTGSSMVSNSNAMETNADQSVVPSIEFLKSIESIQCEVEKHLADLRTINEITSKGRVKSWYRGPGDIFVKNLWIGLKILF